MTAYLVGFIDTRLGVLVGASYYSEPHPTMFGSFFPVVLASHGRGDYGPDLADLQAHVEVFPPYQWFRPFIVDDQTTGANDAGNLAEVGELTLKRLVDFQGHEKTAVDLDEIIKERE